MKTIKKSAMKKISLLFVLFINLNFLYVSGQRLSGNVNCNSWLGSSSLSSGTFSTKSLGYANINIFKNGKLVANVLTDANGNYNVKLDTGVYQCEINYAGFEKITKEIKISKDEISDFSLPADVKSKYSAYDMLSYINGSKDQGILSYKTVSTKNLWGENKKNDSANYGKLTAGEINDFSKWNLWTDLTKIQLIINLQHWNFAPTNRYTIQLKDQNGLPLANANAELINENKVIYTSKTDNTGKAELWGSLKYDTSNTIMAPSIRVNYNGETKTIKNVKKIDAGINTLVLDTKCEQSQNVDIAIVMDATGSMQDEIDYIKVDLNDVIYKSKEYNNKLNFRFANVFYRDYRDVYLTETQDFTGVLSESVAFTNKHNADGGGDDVREAVDVALDTAINKLSWNADTRTKIIFLVLDASPHETPEIQQKMRDLCYKAAGKGIRIVPITGSPLPRYGSNIDGKNTEYLMRCLALATNGTYIFLTNQSGIGNSHVNPSTDNYQTEFLNDLLVRVIKSFTYMPDCQQFIADMGVNLPDSQVVINNLIDSTNIDTAGINFSVPIIKNDSIELKWKFYPNPTNGIINIVANKGIPELYISDLSGKVIQTVENIESDKVVMVDLSEYSTGIYLIRYPTGKQWISGKIMLIQ